MHPVDTDNVLVDALLIASRALVGVAARSLADVDQITLPQWRALVVLSNRPGASVGDLAEALDVHPSTATRLCDRLVRKRLVRRTQGTQDRRSTQLHLTAGGRRLVERVTARRRRDLAAIVSRMPEEARRGAVDVLGAFTDAAGEQAGIDLFGWHDPASDRAGRP